MLIKLYKNLIVTIFKKNYRNTVKISLKLTIFTLVASIFYLIWYIYPNSMIGKLKGSSATFVHEQLLTTKSLVYDIPPSLQAQIEGDRL